MAKILSIKDLNWENRGEMYQILAFGAAAIDEIKKFLLESGTEHTVYIIDDEEVDSVIFGLSHNQSNAAILSDLSDKLRDKNPDRKDFDGLSAHVKCL